MRREIIRVGLIGSGMIGRVHARAYQQLVSQGNLKIELILLSLPNHPVDDGFLLEIGSPKLAYSVDDFFAEQLDLVDICTPNDSHALYTELACQIGAHVYCEKPLGRDLADAERMVGMARNANVLTHVAFIFRYIPAVQQMMDVVHAGDIGEPYHFRAAIFHGGYLDPARPASWRLNKDRAVGGALADLGIHMIDLLRAALGEIAWIQCESRTFINRRPLKGGSKMASIDVDDWAACIFGTRKGAGGTLEVSRLAAGRNQYSILEIYGEKGSVAVDFIHPKNADIFLPAVSKWKPIDRKEYNTRLPVASQLIQKANSFMDTGYAAHVAAIEDFLISIREGNPTLIDFENGMKNQAVLEAAYRSSGSDGVRVNI